MTDSIEQLRLQSVDWGIEIDDQQLSLLHRYADLLAGYQLANVIGTKARDKVVQDHLIDALSCFVAEDLGRVHSLVDVGTGAGLPGIPLGIVRSDLEVTLLEATEKKVRFLDHARAQLGLQNLRVIHSRVEDAGRKPEYRETFDIATARALATLSVVIEYCAPFVRVGGTILAMKGRLSEEELSQGVAASRELGVHLRGALEVAHSAWLPHKERRLVLLDKVDPTPSKFPRRVGQATKRPLGN